MITVRQIPPAAAADDSQELLVEITENVCRPYLVNSSIQPVATVVFDTGTVKPLNDNVVVPLIAKVTIVVPNPNGCGCAKTQVFTETVDIGFAAGTTNVPTLAPGDNVTQTPAYVGCCKARGVKLTTTLTLSMN